MADDVDGPFIALPMEDSRQREPKSLRRFKGFQWSSRMGLSTFILRDYSALCSDIRLRLWNEKGKRLPRIIDMQDERRNSVVPKVLKFTWDFLKFQCSPHSTHILMWTDYVIHLKPGAFAKALDYWNQHNKIGKYFKSVTLKCSHIFAVIQIIELRYLFFFYIIIKQVSVGHYWITRFPPVYIVWRPVTS